MSFTCCKPLILKLLTNNGKKTVSFLSGPNYQCLVPSVNYSQYEGDFSQEKLSKAMQAYLERTKQYDEFLKEQLSEYERGKKFLQGMMGDKNKEMSQQDVDKAIQFLFPSGLFNVHALPKFKRPEEIFEKKKAAQFDFTGRPFHCFFYTTKPNYSQMLHDAGKKLLELQLYEIQMIKSGNTNLEKKISLGGEDWLSQKELEKKLLEKMHPLEYQKFLEVFTRLVEHPFSYIAQEYIKSFRKKIDSEKKKVYPIALPGKDGIMHAVIKCERKTSTGTVTVSYPGSGEIRINGTGLDYFLHTSEREQVLFPLFFTDMENRVDVTASVEGGGSMSQAGVVRFGIAQGLRNFVSEELLEKMKLAGLLQRDFRRRERKKVGREGARRGYTWLKR